MRNLVLVAAVVMVGCGGSGVSVGGTGGGHHGTGGAGAGNGGNGGSGAGTGGNGGSGAGGGTQNCVDADGDGVSTCAGDCDDNNKDVYPGAMETQNGVDDDCDGKVDNNICGQDYDMDGANDCETDCNDNDPNVGPHAVEVPGDMVDNNCNGQVDEAPATCDTGLSNSVAGDYAKAIGLCDFVTNSQFVVGNNSARDIRAKLGNTFTPQEGTSMFYISTGKATDDMDTPSYDPQPGTDFSQSGTHPLWAAPKCGGGGGSAPAANDMTEIDFTIQVPQNANAFTYNFAFFSAEYPEYVCTPYNDRFIAILESTALDTTMLPAGQCVAGAAKPSCNISYDMNGQPVTINNGFFDVCDSYHGWNADMSAMVNNDCSKPASMLTKTSYDVADIGYPGMTVGGGTGWLKTTAPVKPNEVIKLRFIILDEGDGIYDSSVLIDNFQWSATAVAAPVTVPTIN
jgi:hypothetical protein